MARKTIKAVSIGSHERSKLNDNFTELYAGAGANTTATAAEISRACDVSSRVITLSSVGPLTMTEALHEGKIIALNNATGATCYLPLATGSGGVYRFIVTTTLTGASVYTIEVSSASDIMVGTAHLAQDGGDTSVVFETAADSDAILMNLDTKGGIKGTYIELIDVATNMYYVRLVGKATGTEATPFASEV